VLVLGGVFAGVGVARKLEDADVGVLVNKHHRFPRAPTDWVRAGFTHRRPGRITGRTHDNQEDLK
jgi:hypothetical protein